MDDARALGGTLARLAAGTSYEKRIVCRVRALRAGAARARERERERKRLIACLCASTNAARRIPSHSLSLSLSLSGSPPCEETYRQLLRAISCVYVKSRRRRRGKARMHSDDANVSVRVLSRTHHTARSCAMRVRRASESELARKRERDNALSTCVSMCVTSCVD